MNEFLLNLGVVLVFTLIGGFFAAAEIALVSLRPTQVQRLAEEHKRGAKVARLVASPNRFLAAVQVGVTLAGFLSAGFGASRMSPQLAPVLIRLGLPPGAADGVAFVLITLLLVYLSLVLGELVPKRLALQRAESVSLAVAGLVDLLARVSRPFIWLLSRSTDLLVRIVGGDPGANKEEVTEDELRGMLATQTTLTEQERDLIDDVFQAGERELREVMVPRTEVDFLEADLPAFKAARLMAELPHSRYPVCDGSQDDIIGFVHVRDVLDPAMADRGIRVADLAREVPRFPGSKQVIPAMAEMRAAGAHLAIVVDEYGGTAGIVTLEDLVEELVGDIRDEYDDVESERLQLASGEMVVDGLLNLDDFSEETGVELPDGPYETVAGFLVASLGDLPTPGAVVDVGGHRLTVEALDGRRAARIRVTVLAEPEAAGGEPDLGSEQSGERDGAGGVQDSPA